MGIKGNETVYKIEKEAIGMPEVDTTKLFYTNYYPPIKNVKNSKQERNWETRTSKLHSINFYIEEKESIHNIYKKYEIKLIRPRIELLNNHCERIKKYRNQDDPDN